MQFANLASRRKCLINQHFSLRMETELAQLRSVLDRVQTMLDQHLAIEQGTSRVRVSNFAGASFEFELWAFGTTGDWTKFTAIQQDVILKVAEIVAASGARFAVPEQRTYLSRDIGVGVVKADDVARHATEPGAVLQAEDIPLITPAAPAVV